jgi:hypothetical protein
VRDFLNQLNSINWVVAIVLAIPLSIIANLLTNPLRNWMGRWSAKRAEQRNRELEKQLRSIEALTQSSLELGLRLATLAIFVLILFAMGSALIAMASIFPDTAFVFLGVFLYALAIIVGVATISTIERVRGFEAYRERTERAIADLKARASREP